MGIFTEQAVWEEDIFQLELNSPAMGGPDGPLNTAAGQLANRTRFLKDFSDEVEAAREGEATLKARINKRGVEPQDILSRYQYIGNEPVAASTGNVDVVTGGTKTIDGVACAIGNLVFLKDQTNPKENGFWEVQSGAWNRYAGYRPEDADCFTYQFIPINKGTANAGKIFFLDMDRYTIGEDNLNFKESIFSSSLRPGKAVIRDKSGKTGDIIELGKTLTAREQGREGRNLFDVLGVSTIAQAMAALRTLCNGTGTPDFSKLQLGDYIDGLNLSAIPAENGGTAGQAWNGTYKNNRISIAAFNPYKGVGDTEVTKNHIRFDFVNIPLRKRMNPTNDNVGGYKATEIRAFLEGVDGNGNGDYAGTTTVTTGAFLSALKAQLGDYILQVRRLLSIKPASGASWAWMTCSLWLPSENEIFGANAWGESGYGDGQKLHIPLYCDSYAYRIKRYNGGRDWWWLCTPHSASAVFCSASNNGIAALRVRVVWVAAPPLSVLRKQYG